MQLSEYPSELCAQQNKNPQALKKIRVHLEDSFFVVFIKI